MCYLFGRDLYRQMPGVPIGLVASDVGGVKIETLMSDDALHDDTCGGTKFGASLPAARAGGATRSAADARDADVEDAPGAAGVGVGLGAGPGDLWNGMISPLLEMRFTGVVFYQGESNSLAGCPSAYACLFPALIADWRAKFGLGPDLGFFFVQLAACEDLDASRLAVQTPNMLSHRPYITPTSSLGSALDSLAPTPIRPAPLRQTDGTTTPTPASRRSRPCSSPTSRWRPPSISPT